MADNQQQQQQSPGVQAGLALGALGNSIFNFLNSDPNSTNTQAVSDFNTAAGAGSTSLGRQQSIIDAILGGTSSPAYKQALDQYSNYNEHNNINNINDQVMQNRQSLARGGPGLFINQDRRDEATSSALAKQNEDANLKSNDSVMKQFQTAGLLQGQNASGYGGLANDYGNLLKTTTQEQQQQTQNQGNDIASTIGAIGAIASLF